MSNIKVGVHVLATKVGETSRRIVAQLGSAVGDTYSDNSEWYQHVGFVSMPPNPEAGKSAATTVTVEDGGRDVVIASQDLRGLELYGNLKPGDACVYSAGLDGTKQAKTLWRGDGAITTYTTEGNIAGGRAIYFRTGPGVDVATGAPDGFSWAAPWGTMKFDWTGFHIVLESGAEFHLGGITGLPAPLDQIGTYCRIQSATMTTSSSNQSLGAGPGLPLASAPGVLAALTAIQTALTALQAAVAAVPSGTGPAAAATPALIASAAAIAAGAVSIPSSTQSSL